MAVYSDILNSISGYVPNFSTGQQQVAPSLANQSFNNVDTSSLLNYGDYTSPLANNSFGNSLSSYGSNAVSSNFANNNTFGLDSFNFNSQGTGSLSTPLLSKAGGIFDSIGGLKGTLGLASAGIGLANAIGQFGAAKTAKKSLQFQKDAFNKNYNATKKTTNSRIRDRRAERIYNYGNAETIARYGKLDDRLIK